MFKAQSMADLLYLTSMAHTCRRMATDARELETAFNLFELAKVYDQQVLAASAKLDRRPRSSAPVVRLCASTD